MSRRKKLVREFFRRSVFGGDGHKCRKCGATENLAAHHITDRSKMPNGGYCRENGITLCEPCHYKAEQFHISDGRWWEPGYHPNELYSLIGSDYETALLASKRLGPYNPYPRRDPGESEYSG